MKCLGKKNTSKRKSLKLQHKIAKKSTAKGAGLRSEARKAAKAGVKIKGSKPKVKIPNNWPFKREELLFQQQKQEQHDADRQKQKDMNRQMKTTIEKKKRKAEAAVPTRPVNQIAQTLKNADIIVEVVDARDPLASRCVGVENLPSKPHKILIVTKGDLIPREALHGWLAYLREKTGHPVLSLMKCAAPADAKKIIDCSKLETGALIPNAGGAARFVKPVGFRNLIKLMKGYGSLGKNIAVVGYAGVGKHTVESYLKSPQVNLQRKSKLSVATLVEEAEVEKRCPDLLFAGRPQAAQNPLLVFKRLLERSFSKKDLQVKLNLPAFEDARELLARVQTERSLGGPHDAARSLLKIWNQLRYYTVAPSVTVAPTSTGSGMELSGAVYSNESSLELSVSSQVTALTEVEMAELYREDAADVDGVADWGHTTATTGLLTNVLSRATLQSTKTAMQGVTGNTLDSKLVYHQIKLPVREDDLTHVTVGGPEPFQAWEAGTESTEKEDAEMLGEEVESEEDEEKDMTK